MIRGCPPVVPVGCGVVSGAAGSAGSDVATALIKAVTGGVTAAAGWLVGHLVTLVGTTTTVDLGAPWFLHREQAMVALMAILIVPLLAAGTISAIIRQDPRRLARTWAVALPTAAVVTVAVITLTQLALAAADAMTAVVTHNADLGAYATFAKLLVTESATGGPPFVALIIAVAVIVGAVFVWLELVVRSAAVYVAVFFLPLALAGLVWPATAHMAKRLVEGLAALILAKFVIVATLTLGAGAVASVQGVDQVAAGTAILFVAAFAPFVLFRMVPIIEASAVAHLEGLSRRPARALTSGAALATTLATPAGAALNAVRSAGQGSPVPGSAVAAQTVAMARPSYDPAAGGPVEDEAQP
ncbi:MAG: hypothetical protein M3Y91_19340 [Actinomycetota bacterium]|nr:hypothetical protein [Actinomycetota bacterium]